MGKQERRTKRLHLMILKIILVVSILPVTSAIGKGKEAVLYDFQGDPDGEVPVAGVTMDASGNLYGTTSYGGDYNSGTVFKVIKSGTYRILYSFKGSPDGYDPEAGITIDKNGDLYGTTYGGGSGGCTGGCGTVFKISPSGKENVVYSFAGQSSGAFPTGGVVIDKSRNLYGVTYQGGASNDGTVFKVTSAGDETVVYSFAGGNDGENPYGTLVMVGKNKLYGTTSAGGGTGCSRIGCGTVFQVASNGTETIIHAFGGFNTDGSEPQAGLIADKFGDLFGTTVQGGTSGVGIVFEVTNQGQEKVIYSFQNNGADGAEPFGGLILAPKGGLYGTTYYGGEYGSGTVFKVTPGGRETILYSFQYPYGGDGEYPDGTLAIDSKDNLYGATAGGGNTSYGYGTVFKLSE